MRRLRDLRQGSLVLRLLLTCAIMGPIIGCAGDRENPPDPKVVVIGFDGMTLDRLLPLCEEGLTPNFAELLKSGYSAVLQSVLPPSSPPAWTTAVTGVNPGKHGIYGFLKHRKYADNIFSPPAFISAADRRAAPIWKILGERNRRVCLINIPITSPPDSVNGIMISGFPHDPAAPLTYPRSLRDEIPGYRIDLFGLQPRPGQERTWLSNLRNLAATRADLSAGFLERDDWDLFWVVFTGIDRIQHFFWKHADPDHPLHTPNGGADFGEAITEFHIFMDGLLGKLLDLIPEDATLIVMSDHGFGPVYRGINANRLLASPALGGVAAEGQPFYYNDYFGGKFFVNLQGREPGGTVMPGSEYEKVRNDLKSLLLDLKDPWNEKKVIEHVYFREEILEGPSLETAPDVIAVPADTYILYGSPLHGRSISPSLPPVATVTEDLFSGFHRREGILIVRGPHSRMGKSSVPGNIVDIAPTIMYFLDLPIPDHFDGRVFTECVDDSYLEGNPVEPFETGGRFVLNPEERGITSGGGTGREVAEQLRSLGYIR